MAGLTTDTGPTRQFHLTTLHRVRLEDTKLYGSSTRTAYIRTHLIAYMAIQITTRPALGRSASFQTLTYSCRCFSLGFRQFCSTQLVYRLCPFPTNCPLTYRPEPYGLPPARTTRASPDRVGGRCR
jgi:hypothetical protein